MILFFRNISFPVFQILKLLLHFPHPHLFSVVKVSCNSKEIIPLRLCLGLSHLREHKFKYNFKDFLNQLCKCGAEVESTSHSCSTVQFTTTIGPSSLALLEILIAIHQKLPTLLELQSYYTEIHLLISLPINSS